jgi:hypothetical protein
MTPLARQDDLMVEELADETVVYDVQRDKVHRLNRTAALIWRQCDGHTTVAAMVPRLEKALNLPVDEAVIWLALERLGRADLLRERLPRPAVARLTRRELVRQLGLMSAALLPVVSSLVVTLPAHGHVLPGCKDKGGHHVPTAPFRSVTASACEDPHDRINPEVARKVAREQAKTRCGQFCRTLLCPGHPWHVCAYHGAEPRVVFHLERQVFDIHCKTGFKWIVQGRIEECFCQCVRA